MIDDLILEWLFENGDPSLQYRVLTELLGKQEADGDVAAVKAQIPDSQAARIIFDRMHPDGYWLQTNPRTGIVAGDGVEYGAFATTHFCLSYLAELGLSRSNAKVEKAADRYLNLQQPDGDWMNHFSCLIGLNVRTFAMLGYGDDPRVRKALELLLQTDRPDGGYLCDMHEGKYKKRPVKSCVRGAAKALLAFSYFPEYWEHKRVKLLIQYFIGRGGIYRSNDLSSFVNNDVRRVSFPVTWRVNIWEILYALGRMGYGKEQRLRNAWQRLEENQNADGRYLLDWTPVQCPWKIGKRAAPNKWVTFYSLKTQSLR